MKALLTVLALGFSFSAMAATTEVVFFEGYQGYNTYVSKNVSTVEAPLVAEWLTADPALNVAICFNGDVTGVVPVIEAMVMNSQTMSVLPTYTIEPDQTSVGQGLVVKNLQIRQMVNNQAWTWTMAMLRPCKRTSKK